MLLPLAQPPRSVCILRLSALGDTCHVVPIIRTLQHAWPATQLTWIIGKAEARLMSLVDGVEFITVDKRAGFGARHALREQLRGRQFDVLLHMQLALRASLVARNVSATVKLGFDRARARDLQWMFTNARVAAADARACARQFFWLSGRARHQGPAGGVEYPACRRMPAPTLTGSFPTRNRRWSSVPARVTRCVTGGRSAMPRWPTTRRAGITCA